MIELKQTRTAKVRVFLSPPVAALGVYPRVTGLAQGDQIISRMCAAFGQRDLVVYFLGRRKSAFMLTQLAHRMRLHIAVADSFPCASVPTAYSRVAVVLLVALGFQLGVFFTEPSVCKSWTAGVRTR